MGAGQLSQIVEALERARTESGETLAAISAGRPVLLVFLRHAGCTFCREALGDIAQARRDIESAGVRIVLVHMGDTEAIGGLLERYGLAGVDHIADAGQGLYGAFGLKRGDAWALFGPRVWWRGFRAGILAGHGIGRLSADGAQLPGAFLLGPSGIVRRFRHRSASDRPDYRVLANIRLSSRP